MGVPLGLPRKRTPAAKAPTMPANTNGKGVTKTKPSPKGKNSGEAGGDKADHCYYPAGMRPTNGKKQQPQAKVDDSKDYDAINATFTKTAVENLLAVEEVDPGFFAANDAMTDLKVHTLDSGFVHVDRNFITPLIPTTVAKNWGIKPYPTVTEEGPQFNNYDDQPPARTSDAATIPALWEDKVERFQHGQHVNGVDQKTKVLHKLMDMRPANSDHPNGESRRLPMVYECKGIPLNWSNKTLIKAMNDRRYQALQRARDAPRWDTRERVFVVEVLSEFPDISIHELTERLNFRFQGDCVESTMFCPHKLHPGRTIEDVRGEYLEHKHDYDHGVVPTASRMNKELGLEEKNTAMELEKIFKLFAPIDKNGTPIKVQGKRTRRTKNQIEKDNKLEHSDDDSDNDEEGVGKISTTPTPKKQGGVATPLVKKILKPKSQIAKTTKGVYPPSLLAVKKIKIVEAPRDFLAPANLSKKRKHMDDSRSNSMPIPKMRAHKRVKFSDAMLAQDLEQAAPNPEKAQNFRIANEKGNFTKTLEEQLLELAGASGWTRDEAEAAGALVQMSADPARLRVLAQELSEVAGLVRERATAAEEVRVSAHVDGDGDSEMEDVADEELNGYGGVKENDEDLMI